MISDEEANTKRLKKVGRLMLSMEDMEMEVQVIEEEAMEMMELDEGKGEEIEILETGIWSRDYLKSPSLIDGRRERFGDISRMISHWEEMEGEETSR